MSDTGVRTPLLISQQLLRKGNICLINNAMIMQKDILLLARRPEIYMAS